jgi:trimeric autotransporter adhesin
VTLASAMCCAFSPCFTPIHGRCCLNRAPLAHAAARPCVHRRARLLTCSAEPQAAATASAEAGLQLQQFSDETTASVAAQTSASSLRRSKYNKRRRARKRSLVAAATSADSHSNDVASETVQQQPQQQQSLQAPREARVNEQAAAPAAQKAEAPRGVRPRHTLSPLQQNSTSRADSTANSSKKQIRTRPFEQRNKTTSSRPNRRNSSNSTSSSSSSSSSSSDSTSILGSRAKDSSSSSSLKELENSFERVIRALSKPVTAAALQASLDGSSTSSTTAATSSAAAATAEAAKKKVETTMDAAARAASKRSRRRSSSTSSSRSNSSNPSIGDSPTVRTGSFATVTDTNGSNGSYSRSQQHQGSSSSSSSSSSSVGGVTSTGRIEPPLRVDPPQRYVEVIYNRRARDVFTWITTNSESFGTVLSHEQASRMNKRSRISWLLQVSAFLTHHIVSMLCCSIQ